MPVYELYEHAGQIDFAEWKARGIELPIFDKDGTITSYNQLDLLETVIAGLEDQAFGDVFPNVAVVSNNHDSGNVHEFADELGGRLGVSVFKVSGAEGYPRKPDPAMGLQVAEHFGVTPNQLGVVGDRRLVDVRFGAKLGAGAVALCEKIGEGDANWVPLLRRLERPIVWLEHDATEVPPLV